MATPSIQVAIALGYKIKNDQDIGICKGLAYMGAQAIYRHDAKTFIERIIKIKSSGFCIETLSSNEKLDLHAFFDGVFCNHYPSFLPESMTDLIEPEVQNKRLELVKLLFDPAGNGKMLGEYQIPQLVGEILVQLTRERLQQYLLEIKENNQRKSFALILGHAGHATCIGFDGSKWLAVNHDAVVMGEREDELVELLIQALPNSYNRNGLWFASIQILGDLDLTLPKASYLTLDVSSLKSVDQKLDVMWLCAFHMHLEEIESLVTSVLNDPALSLKEKKRVFTSNKYIFNPSTCFHSEGLRIYMKLVLNSTLQDITKYHLLKMHGPSEIPKLHGYLNEGNSKDLIIYLDFIISSFLPYDLKMKLLYGVSAQGFPAISSAFSTNNKHCATTLSLYMQKLFSSELSSSDLETIMIGERKQEKDSALLLAVIDSRHYPSHTYITELLKSSLAPEVKVRILCYEWDDKCYLFHAIRNKNYGFYRDLIGQVLGSELSELNKLKIICGATRYFNAHALAREAGMDHLVDEISEEVSSSTLLSDQFKREFLKFTSKNNASIRFFIPNGDIEWVEEGASD